MTTATRPLRNPTYLTILAQVAALGEATYLMLTDIPDASWLLGNMRKMGLVAATRTQELRGRRSITINRYRMTDKGRVVLATGEIVPSPTSDFNGRRQQAEPKPVAFGCVHSYIVGPPPRQHHTCRYCKKEFDQPMTYGLELAKVGAGKVTKSERFS